MRLHNIILQRKKGKRGVAEGMKEEGGKKKKQYTRDNPFLMFVSPEDNVLK